jgi:gas vesicle protein
MSTINSQLKALLPHLAGPISTLLASAPKKSARGNILVPSIVGVASAGVLVGVAIGLLVAPQNGKEMRRQLSSAVSSFRDEVVASLERISSGAEDATVIESEDAQKPQRTTATANGRDGDNGGTRRQAKPARA